MPNPLDTDIEITDEILQITNAICINPLDGSLMYIDDIHILNEYIISMMEYIDLNNHVSPIQYPVKIDLCVNDTTEHYSYSYTTYRDGSITQMRREIARYFPPSFNRVIISKNLLDSYKAIYSFNHLTI